MCELSGSVLIFRFLVLWADLCLLLTHQQAAVVYKHTHWKMTSWKFSNFLKKKKISVNQKLWLNSTVKLCNKYKVIDHKAKTSQETEALKKPQNLHYILAHSCAVPASDKCFAALHAPEQWLLKWRKRHYPRISATLVVQCFLKPLQAINNHGEVSLKCHFDSICAATE